jgi:hypothetical protein
MAEAIAVAIIVLISVAFGYYLGALRNEKD